MDELFQEAVKENNSIRVCRRRRPRWRNHSESESESESESDSTIRFVPATYSTPLNLSSTGVREIIQRNLPHEQLLRELQALVRFPGILLDMLASKRWEERMPESLS